MELNHDLAFIVECMITKSIPEQKKGANPTRLQAVSTEIISMCPLTQDEEGCSPSFCHIPAQL